MNRLKIWSLALGCSAIVLCSLSTIASAQTFNVGDVVEVDDTGMNYWERGVIMPFKPNDVQDGNTYRVKRDKGNSLRDPAGEISQTIHIRKATSASAATAASPASTTKSTSVSAASSYAVSAPSYPSGSSYSTSRASTSPRNTSIPSSSSGSPTNSASGLNPRMNGAFPSLPGTGWDLMNLQEKGKPPTPPKSFAQSFSFCKTGRWSNTRYGLTAGMMGTYTVNGNKLLMINSLNNEPFGNFTMTWRASDKSLILDSGTFIWTLQLVSLNACGEN